ncbi:hypothetical protein IFM89_028320 [Coptis chinensis]|uniref:F-box protein n=1 Tax=Coptis chinensis TaxID=261450 RepID=A0A835I433_9MAGN|nr:hypothetical protein IFM89_028320 [Coptis chinensis]
MNSEADPLLGLRPWLVTQRPWLDLYGVHVKPVVSKPNYDPALIHRCLPDELLFEIFVRMTPHGLGRGACVCRKWRYTIRNPVFWRTACLKAWQASGPIENYKIVQSKYEWSWRKMWLLRPRVRTDGIYVSRNTYIHVGVAEWKITNPVHLVCYFRYMRFFPSGRFFYKNSSQIVKDVAKSMTFHASKADSIPSRKREEADSVFSGHYTLLQDEVDAAFLYPGLHPTVLRLQLRLRGTMVGANNRMDIISLVTSKETHNPDVPAVSHRRGLNPFVFVPFEEVETSVLNLPVDKMDYYLPG